MKMKIVRGRIAVKSQVAKALGSLTENIKTILRNYFFNPITSQLVNSITYEIGQELFKYRALEHAVVKVSLIAPTVLIILMVDYKNSWKHIIKMDVY